MIEEKRGIYLIKKKEERKRKKGEGELHVTPKWLLVFWYMIIGLLISNMVLGFYIIFGYVDILTDMGINNRFPVYVFIILDLWAIPFQFMSRLVYDKKLKSDKVRNWINATDLIFIALGIFIWVYHMYFFKIYLI